MRLVDADKLYNKMLTYKNNSIIVDEYCRDVIDTLLYIVRTAELVETENGKEKWTDPEDDNDKTTWYCSKCGFPVQTLFGKPYYKYCPECGVRMKR